MAEKITNGDMTVKEISKEDLWKAISNSCPCCGKDQDPYAMLHSTDDFGIGFYCEECREKIRKVNEICKRGAKRTVSVKSTFKKWQTLTDCPICQGQLFLRPISILSVNVKICPNCDTAFFFAKE